MATGLSYLALVALSLSTCLAVYLPNNYGSAYPPSYQTYDRRLIEAFKPVARPVAYSAYETPLYSPLKEYQPVGGYGSQSRTSYPGSYSIVPAVRRPVSLYDAMRDSYASPQIYTPSIYDPCNNLPEGDYALQGDFLHLFPGIDAQCNFVKCANYKAYVNPCSVGTKNLQDGGPDAKYGFCASLDYNHYCGLYPASTDTYSKR